MIKEAVSTNTKIGKICYRAADHKLNTVRCAVTALLVLRQPILSLLVANDKLSVHRGMKKTGHIACLARQDKGLSSNGYHASVLNVQSVQGF